MGKLDGKVAIVTGSAGGLGAAFAIAMAKEGAKLAIPDVNIEGAENTAKTINSAGGEAIAMKTDVSVEKDTLEMAKQTADRFGGIDILVNNAAIIAAIPFTRTSLDKISVEEWNRVLAVNLTGAWLCVRAVLPYMRQRGKGKIINISAPVLTYKSIINRCHYIAAKAALIGLTQTWSQELGDDWINVNAILPGSTLSHGAEYRPERKQAAVALRALKRAEVPEDLVGAMIFLASSDSDFITGQCITVDGGQTDPPKG